MCRVTNSAVERSQQGWAQDLFAQDRDETETSSLKTETRPRRLTICPRRDQDRDPRRPRRDRDETSVFKSIKYCEY